MYVKTHIKKIISKNILFLLLSTLLFFIAYQLLLPTFPLYIKHLGGNEKIAGLLTGLFTFSAIFLRPYFGKLSDRKGRKIVLYIGSFIMVTAPLLYTIELGFIYLSIVIIYHSISIAAFITASQTLLGDFSDSETSGTLVGIYGIVITCSVAVVPSIAFKIINLAGFPSLFYIASLAGVILFFSVKLIETNNFIHNDNKKENAASFRKILNNKWVLIASIAIFSVTISNGAINTFLPLHGVSVGIQNIGIYFTIFAISSIITRFVIGNLSDKVGRKKLILPGFIVLALGHLCFTRLSFYIMFIIGAIMIGFGFSATHTLLLALIIDKTSLRGRSQAVSFFNNAYDLGMTVGAMGLGAIAAYSYSILWITVAGIIFVGCIFIARFY